MTFFRRIPVEAWPGITLIACAIVAMLIVNSAFGPDYQALLYATGVIGLGDATLSMSLAEWIKNALMAIFFFFAGLELKKELLEGELSNPAAAALPLAGAIGGMALPAILFLAIAGPYGYAQGWAIPAATDIAFALGVLALLGPRVPMALKAFLLAVAVIDDLGAILIVATVYSSGLDVTALLWSAGLFAVMVALNRLGVKTIGVYVLAAIPLWVAMQLSGINPTIAGVLAAATIPLHGKDGSSPLHDAEHAMRPYVLFLVMPIFALANAGAVLGGGLVEALAHPVALGIAAGLAIGKPLGITGLTLLAARLLGAKLPGRPIHILGVACIAGIGFTMSLFIGALAFADPTLATPVRMGVYLGSLASAVAGLTILAMSLGRGSAVAPGEADPTRPFIAAEETPPPVAVSPLSHTKTTAEHSS